MSSQVKDTQDRGLAQEVHARTRIRRELRKLYDSFAADGMCTKSSLKKALKESGLAKRLVKDFFKLVPPEKNGNIAFEAFAKLGLSGQNLYIRALSRKLVIPKWRRFTRVCANIFDSVEELKDGNIATYIPQLAQVDPEQFGVAICSVDGQVWSMGDCKSQFTLQSCAQTVTYCIALEQIGEENLSRHVGHEPSGRAYNAFCLDKKGLPHNPLINAGAITTSSLTFQHLDSAKRFEALLGVWQKMNGGTPVQFDYATYLSELDHSDRNFGLAFYLRDSGVLAKDTDIPKTLEFYFSVCSLVGCVESVAVMMSPLANGGRCAITNEEVFQPKTVQNALSVMFSCGMYDNSGEFAYEVGIPAKSGVSGCVVGIIPGVCSICVWSPRLDEYGSSVRGVAFFQELVKKFPFHIFDSAENAAGKVDPTYSASVVADEVTGDIALSYAASKGDIHTVLSLVNSGVNVKMQNYDGRTALHGAVEKKRYKMVSLLRTLGADPEVKDRRGESPRDLAISSNDPLLLQAIQDDPNKKR